MIATDANRKKIINATFLAVLFLLLLNGFYYIDKYVGGVAYFVLIVVIPVLFFTIIVNVIREVIRIIKNRHNLTFAYFLPVIIYLLVPFIPIPEQEQFLSKVVLHGCYEGTQNQSYLLFRQDHTFEVHATGIFFSSDWYTGNWQKRGDTILLNYGRGNVNPLLGDKVIIRNNLFNRAGSYKDTTQSHAMFYAGYCKGLN